MISIIKSISSSAYWVLGIGLSTSAMSLLAKWYIVFCIYKQVVCIRVTYRSNLLIGHPSVKVGYSTFKPSDRGAQNC